MPGGGWGKATVCPEDAAGAHELWQQADKQPIPGKYVSAKNIHALSRFNIS